MLLAQAADTAIHVPWWLTLLISMLSAVGGSALTLAGGWFLLTRTEAYRQASRWEPMAEQLWHERFRMYERLILATDEVARSIFQITGSAGKGNASTLFRTESLFGYGRSESE
jgi:hypothetical protein